MPILKRNNKEVRDSETFILVALVPAVPRRPMLPKKLGLPRVTNTSPASYRAQPPR